MFSSIFNYTKLGLWCLIYALNFHFSKKHEIFLLEIILNNIQNTSSLGTKCIQKIIPYLYLTHYDNNVIELLKTTYESNEKHNINFTEKLYEKDFNENINDKYLILDCVSSGSIGQVYKVKDKNTDQIYALKVKHPNVNYQLNIIKKFILFFNIHKKSIFDILGFIKNFEKETDFRNEAKNMKRFFNYYKDIDNFLIPDVYEYTENIILMEYIDGTRIDKLNLYSRNKYISLFVLFSNNNKLVINFNHGDCHIGNFKKHSEDKIVIYDFGYCFELEDKKLGFIMDDFWSTLNDHEKYDNTFEDCIRFIITFNIQKKDISFLDDDLEEFIFKDKREGKITDENDALSRFINLFKKHNLMFRVEYLNVLLIYYHTTNYIDCDQRDLYSLCKNFDILHDYQNILKDRIFYDNNIESMFDATTINELKNLM